MVKVLNLMLLIPLLLGLGLLPILLAVEHELAVAREVLADPRPLLF